MSDDIVTISMQLHDRNCAACGDLCNGGYAIPMLEGLIVSNEWKGPWGGFQACRDCYEQHRRGQLPTHDEELSHYLTTSTPTPKDAELTRLRARVAALEARLAVEMAEVEAWRKLPPERGYSHGCNCSYCLKMSTVRAATDASRRAEKENTNAGK